MNEIYCNVEDIYGQYHKKAKLVREYQNTIIVLDMDDELRYVIHKSDVNMQISYPHRKRVASRKFDLTENKHVWKDRSAELKDRRKKYAQRVSN